MINDINIEFKNQNPDTHYFLAISGGIDSMVLSNLLLNQKIEHTLLHCNFNLRGDESDQDEFFIREYAKRNNIKLFVKSVNTKEEALIQNLSIQECARDLRYKWFKSFLTTKNFFLLTAHHLDDSIETFFINLLRGTGLNGISGINTYKNQIVRPLLNYTKDEIINFAIKNKISYREDSSNNSDNYLRNKLRHKTIPELKNFTTDFTVKMNTFFNEVKQTNNFIELQLKSIKKTIELELKISIESLNTYPTFLWHKIFTEFGINRKRNNEFVIFSKSKNGSIYLTNGHTILLDRGYLYIKENTENKKINIQIDSESKNIKLSNQKFTLNKISTKEEIKYTNNVAYLNLNTLKFPLIIRNWRQGDKIQPLGMVGKKMVSDVLINKKINNFDKKNQLVVESNGSIVWLVGLVISEQFALKDDTRLVLKIENIKY